MFHNAFTVRKINPWQSKIKLDVVVSPPALVQNAYCKTGNIHVHEHSTNLVKLHVFDLIPCDLWPGPMWPLTSKQHIKYATTAFQQKRVSLLCTVMHNLLWWCTRQLDVVCIIVVVHNMGPVNQDWQRPWCTMHFDGTQCRSVVPKVSLYHWQPPNLKNTRFEKRCTIRFNGAQCSSVVHKVALYHCADAQMHSMNCKLQGYP